MSQSTLSLGEGVKIKMPLSFYLATISLAIAWAGAWWNTRTDGAANTRAIHALEARADRADQVLGEVRDTVIRIDERVLRAQQDIVTVKQQTR